MGWVAHGSVRKVRGEPPVCAVACVACHFECLALLQEHQKSTRQFKFPKESCKFPKEILAPVLILVLKRVTEEIGKPSLVSFVRSFSSGGLAAWCLHPPNSSGRFVAKGPVLQDVEAKIARLLVRDTGDGNEPGDGDRQPPTAKAVVAWIHQPPKVRRKNAFPQLCRLAPSVQTGQKQPGNDCGQGNFCWVKYWTKFNS